MHSMSHVPHSMWHDCPACASFWRRRCVISHHHVSLVCPRMWMPLGRIRDISRSANRACARAVLGDLCLSRRSLYQLSYSHIGIPYPNHLQNYLPNHLPNDLPNHVSNNFPKHFQNHLLNHLFNHLLKL